MSKEKIAHMIYNARTDAKLSQGELARKMKTNQQSVSRWETGEIMPTAIVLLRIGEACGKKLVFN